MQAHVLSLEHRLDRRKHITEQGAKVGYTPIFHDGVQLKAPASFKHYAIARDGAYSCALGHAKIWQALLDSNQDYFLVLEDDAVFKKHLSRIMGLMPSSFDFFLLGANDSLPFTQRGQELGNGLCKAARVTCLHAYFISRNGALKALKSPYKYTAVDLAVWSVYADGHSYYPSTNFVTQLDSYSDIEQRNVSYKL